MAAEQLARAVEVLHRLLLLAAPRGDLGEALEVAAMLDGAAFALGPFEAGAEPLLGLVDEVEAKGEVAAELVEPAARYDKWSQFEVAQGLEFPIGPARKLIVGRLNKVLIGIRELRDRGEQLRWRFSEPLVGLPASWLRGDVGRRVRANIRDEPV